MSTYIKPKIIRGLLEATQADSALIVKIRKKKKTLGLVSKIQTNFFETWVYYFIFTPRGYIDLHGL